MTATRRPSTVATSSVVNTPGAMTSGAMTSGAMTSGATVSAAPAVVACLLLLLAAAACDAAEPPAAGEPPVAVFAELDGTWEGEFVGWDASGRELYRIRVRQTYRTVDDTTQRVEIRDTMADGTVVTGRGENTARRLEDGSLELRCRVEKSTGEVVEHVGTLVTAPAGGVSDDGAPEGASHLSEGASSEGASHLSKGASHLLWHSRGEGREEIFRERVVPARPGASGDGDDDGGGDVYAIDGTGRYGDQVILMAGRYRRVASDDAAQGDAPDNDAADKDAPEEGP